MAKDRIILYCAGDVGPNRDDPDSMFRKVASVLKEGDICFCQLELNLSSRGTPLPQARLPMRADPASARAIRNAGFHVVSFASNHCMDWGRDAFFDTIDAHDDLAEVERGQQRAVVGQGAHSALDAGHVHRIHLAAEDHFFLGYDVTLDWHIKPYEIRDTRYEIRV